MTHPDLITHFIAQWGPGGGQIDGSIFPTS